MNKSILKIRNALKNRYIKYEMAWKKNKNTKNFYSFLNNENYFMTRDIIKCVNCINKIIRKNIDNKTFFDFFEEIFTYEARVYLSEKQEYKITQTNKLNFNLSRYLRIIDRLIFKNNNQIDDENKLIVELFLLLLFSFSNIYYYFDGISGEYNQIILYIPNLYKKKEIFDEKRNILIDNIYNVKCQYNLLKSYTNYEIYGYLQPNVIFRYLVDNYVNFELYSYFFSLIIMKLNSKNIKLSKEEFIIFFDKISKNYYYSDNILIISEFLSRVLNEQN